MSEPSGAPHISCVIPTHGRDLLLAEALESACAQSIQSDLEIIVVDDLISNATQKLVSDYNDSTPARIQIRYLGRVSSPGAGGASASRNAGAREARGQYLAFLDDDDLWEPDYLSEVSRAMSAAGTDMAISWMRVIERNGQVTPLLSLKPNLAPSDVVARNPGITGSNLIISRDAYWDIGGFDEMLPVSNDKDFFLRFLVAGFRYVPVSKELALHRRHEGEQLTRPNERRANGIEIYLRKHISLTSLADRRFLRQHIHSIRSKTASRRHERLLHKFGALWNYSPFDLAGRLFPRSFQAGRYTSV